jgi:hypothetical protein
MRRKDFRKAPQQAWSNEDFAARSASIDKTDVPEKFHRPFQEARIEGHRTCDGT